MPLRYHFESFCLSLRPCFPFVEHCERLFLVFAYLRTLLNYVSAQYISEWFQSCYAFVAALIKVVVKMDEANSNTVLQCSRLAHH